jgi:hypothetical protein
MTQEPSENGKAAFTESTAIPELAPNYPVQR